MSDWREPCELREIGADFSDRDAMASGRNRKQWSFVQGKKSKFGGINEMAGYRGRGW